ncbi:GAF domain-containing protein [Altererythrobacter xixiisoli]|uniref:histidine kinase n=1 Tax=Croceibacterium xixiisoli TaxID=1476466 RepID=A0A6I4TTG9_9SPHN|nr:HWE histidine kinase domain-containing protein [Croceibacterium xixiisoli]MXO99276.1 GAF domain-containing protein [Croceibacterium xixiisoli]
MTNYGQQYQVDLLNCDQEPIHILGNIQPFGFLVSVGRDWLISRVSVNTAEFSGKSPDELLGKPLSDLFLPQAVHDLRNRLTLLRGPDAVERMLNVQLFDGAPPFDVALHFSGNAIVMEAEPATGQDNDVGSVVRTLLARLNQTSSMHAFLREGARQVRAITGFDRVMIYKFDNDGAGEVIAEAAGPGIDSFMGHHYPASDIPAQARRLYLRNIFRIIADVNAIPVPLTPGLDADGQPLDQSLSVLRAVSPIHIEYLKNMGITASLSISIIVGGRLWGLIACHNYSPRLPGMGVRTASELFGQMFSLMLESRERAEAAEYENTGRDNIDRLVSTIARNAEILHDSDWLAETVLDAIPADGAAVQYNGHVTFKGRAPSSEQFGDILAMLNQASSNQIFVTEHLQSLVPAASEYADLVAGLIAIPLSTRPRDYIVLFRTEQLQSVRWAGNPNKPIMPGPRGDRLTPRKSFEIWAEIVKGKCLPFSQPERRLAEAIRVGMLEVIVRLSENVNEERRRASERQELLIAELNHRVRNILSLIRGLISQTRDSTHTVDGFIGNLDGRIQSLARAHDQITRDRWGPARLTDLLETEARAYLGTSEARVTLSGPEVLLEPVAFTTLALVFHELLTNAVKYGALSDSGNVLIEWRLDEEGCLLIDWTENGGPAVTAPTRRGFGSTIIERAIPHDLGGDADLQYRLRGLHGQFCVPARYIAGISEKATRNAAPVPQHERPKPLAGKQILLVEDSMIISLDAEDALRSLGASDICVFSAAAPALRYLEQAAVDFAVLDFNLGVETSERIAACLAERGVPFVFATGYGEGVDSQAGAAAPIIAKPYGAQEIASAFAVATGIE